MDTKGLSVVTYDPLPDLDALQDQVLEQLELLNQRIEAVLKEFAPHVLPSHDAADAKSKAAA